MPRRSTNEGVTTAKQGLTQDELEVLALLPRGLSDSEIATELTIQVGTVQARLGSIYSKLGVTSRTAASRYAVLHGLL